MTRILVTGADGFIGSHLTEELVRIGFEVRALCLYNSVGSWGWLDKCSPDLKGKFEVVLGDIRDTYSIDQIVKDCDGIFHLASLISIPYSYKSPQSYIDTNVNGTLNLLQAAVTHDISNFVHTSTSEVYGTAQVIPIDENHPIVGQSPYAASKIAADQLAYSFYATYNLPIKIVRPFNTYGPRQSTRAVIPTIINQISKGLKSLSLGQIKSTRDFSYVEDTVEGFIAAYKYTRANGEVFNLGSNFEISIESTVREISKIMGVETSINLDEKRLRPINSEVFRLYSNNHKAKEILNWYPKYTGLEGFRLGLTKTIEWFINDQDMGKDQKDKFYL